MNPAQLAADLAARLQGYLPDLLAGVALAAVTLYVARWVRQAVIKAAVRMGWDEILWSYFGSALRRLAIGVGMTSALKQAGFALRQPGRRL